MKFRFYITSLPAGEILGTDDPNVALPYAECEDYFIVDTATGEWLNPGNERNEVKELKA